MLQLCCVSVETFSHADDAGLFCATKAFVCA